MKPPSSDFGFAPIPRKLLDHLITNSLSKNELLLALLIARLTYGCQNASTVELKLSDLSIIGVRASHARKCIDALISKGIVQKHECRNYSLKGSFLRSGKTKTEREALLSGKVKEQLKSLNSAIQKLPKMEPKTSQNGNK